MDCKRDLTFNFSFFADGALGRLFFFDGLSAVEEVPPLLALFRLPEVVVGLLPSPSEVP
jgi:hypothetical protein